MKTLFLDLASHGGLLACVSDGDVKASYAVDHRIDDASLVPRIEDLLSQAGWSYGDLARLACVTGPGGFTSLRVAVALANTLSHELGIPSYGIHLSDLYAARIHAKTRNSKHETNPNFQASNFEIVSEFVFRAFDGLWLHSTKKNELFTRGFGTLAAEFPEAQCITTDHLKTVLRTGTLWTGELIPEHREILSAAGAKESPLRPLAAILPEFLAGQDYAKQILKPWYGRGW